MEIYKIKLSLSNAYLIKGRKTILVDTGAPREGMRILRLLAQAGIEPKDFSLILHTHAHFDHAGSTLQLKSWIEVPTAVHTADAEMLARGQMGKLTPINLEGRIVQPFVNRAFSGFRADLLIDKEISLKEFGVNGKVVFTPGHTAGSISVLLASGDAIVGDLMMGGILDGNLFPSKPNYHYFADDLAQVKTSIKKLLDLRAKRFYPGHGGPLDAEAVRNRFSTDF